VPELNTTVENIQYSMIFSINNLLIQNVFSEKLFDLTVFKIWFK
jgi:hypothetical protein